MHLQENGITFAAPPLNRLPSVHRKIFCPGNTLIVCVQLADGRVEDAWSTGRMMRSMNLLLQVISDDPGRPCFVRRAHCLCNDGHALAAVRALEDLAGIAPPRSALLVRSLVQALRCIQEHLLHFYQFHLSNWVCLGPALGADPGKTARLADPLNRGPDYFRQVQERLRPLAENKGINGFNDRFCDHPDYRGADEFHLLVHSHSLESLQIQSLLNKALGLLGCKNGRHPAYQMGGLSPDMNLGQAVLQQLHGLVRHCRDFINTSFLTDLEQVARAYPHWKDLAIGSTFLCLGDFARPHDRGLLFPNGITRTAGKNQIVDPARPDRVTEEHTPKWKDLDTERYRLNFGRHGPVFFWNKGNLPWIFAPRHGKDACEAGSLARVMGAFAQGRQEVCKAVNNSLKASGLLPGDMNCALGRLLSRGIESSVLSKAALDWLDELKTEPVGKRALMNQNFRLPRTGVGTGKVEVPRGSLIHTIQMDKHRIIRHDCLIPSMWNFSVRDSKGRRGPLEQALLGTPVRNPDHPLELLRIVHAFDPCNPCHVVVQDADTGRVTLSGPGT